MATANIIVAAGSTLPTPPSGEATLFINTENNNILSLKDSSGNIVPYTDAAVTECCSCEIAKKYMEDIACALKSGMLNASQFATMIDKGLVVESTESTDVAGNKTCTVSIGPKTILPTGLTISNPGSVSQAGGAVTLTASSTPSGSSNEVAWFSSDATKATIDHTGLLTPLLAGVGTAVTIQAVSLVDPSVSATRVVPIVA